MEKSDFKGRVCKEWSTRGGQKALRIANVFVHSPCSMLYLQCKNARLPLLTKGEDIFPVHFVGMKLNINPLPDNRANVSQDTYIL
jgi:hypothetical protein